MPVAAVLPNGRRPISIYIPISISIFPLQLKVPSFLDKKEPEPWFPGSAATATEPSSISQVLVDNVIYNKCNCT